MSDHDDLVKRLLRVDADPDLIYQYSYYLHVCAEAADAIATLTADLAACDSDLARCIEARRAAEAKLATCRAERDAWIRLHDSTFPDFADDPSAKEAGQ